MLPKAQYNRANGMMSLVENASFVISPILAGALIATIGIGGILTIDIISFVVAVLALSLVAIPKPQETEAGRAGRAGRGSLWKEAGYGFRYILDRPSLLGLPAHSLSPSSFPSLMEAVRRFGKRRSPPMFKGGYSPSAG